MIAAFGLIIVVRPVKLSVQSSTPHAAPGVTLGFWLLQTLLLAWAPSLPSFPSSRRYLRCSSC